MIHFQETQYGFDWGAAKIERCCSDDKKGWIILHLRTPKYDHDKKSPPIQIYITKTGKIRIYGKKEWKESE